MTTQLRIDDDLNARLTDIAERLGVSVVWLARKLLTEGLDNMLPVEQIRFTRERTP